VKYDVKQNCTLCN